LPPRRPLLDGQQRITTLYGVVRGKPPKFFDGNVQAFTGLRFHLEAEIFAFYQPLKMQDDPLWIDLTELMQKSTAGLGEFVARLSQNPALAPKIGDYIGRLSRLLGIMDIDLYVEEVTGADKSLDVVVDIFNRVNSGGTRLSKGDLALAKICADWPEGRDTMRQALKGWEDSCLERELTLELIRGMAGPKPERVVCLDEGFAGNDQLKANAVQIFKARGVTSFKTV